MKRSRRRSSTKRATPWTSFSRPSVVTPRREPAPSRTASPRGLRVIADRLAARYGRPTRRRVEALDELIATVLSQATSDINSSRAFASLKRAFPTWERALEAPSAAIERSIRHGGLARLKSRRIQAVLKAVREREGRLALRGLRRLSLASARERLAGLPGVGPKTRACVLLFACGHDAFPVDTHVHRIALRMGLVPARANAERTHEILEPMVPRGRALDLHLNLIRLGREACRPRTPVCGGCALRSMCPTGRERE